MARTCPHCGCSDIDEDTGRGDATCMRCGTVLEESIVVAENQFQERSGGSGHTLVGQFVSLERGQAQARAAAHGLVSQESREVTFARGRKLIEEIASQLRINQHCIDTSYNFFKMSVSRNLTRGRVRSHVVAACLYMTCRLENTAHLLLDFSDVTQVNMFDLGRTLNFLSRSLRINLPSTDPCLYIMRFACLMELGEKLKEVVNLATRLVQRMKRDWMSMGRRPTGLCGAALLLAARAYNFNRTISDVVKVVHISESVVRKRLDEFSKTPSSALTIDEFTTIDLEHEEDPPAFRESRRKAREEQIAKEAEMTAQMERELVLGVERDLVLPIEKEVERALEKKRREKFRNTRYAKIVAGDLDDPEVGVAEGNLVRNEIMDSVYRAADDEEERPKTPDYSHLGPTLHSLGISPLKPSPVPSLNTSVETSTPLPSQDRPDGSLDLSGIDDDEIDTYILTAKESELKERFWMKLNGEHLKEMERRRREREEEEEKEKDNPSKKRRRRTNAPRQNLASSTAIEAMEKIIHEKKLSNKVNYEILKEIEHTATGVEPLEREPNSSQVIENVNNLVATLAMDKMTKSESLLGNTDPFPITPENMSRREREIARRNKPLKDPSALRLAFKMEPSTLFGGVSEIPKAESKPIALSRTKAKGWILNWRLTQQYLNG
ncbi:transcription factor TFIIB repeat-containing domain protein [Cooperia oncophora]